MDKKVFCIYFLYIQNMKYSIILNKKVKSQKGKSKNDIYFCHF